MVKSRGSAWSSSLSRSEGSVTIGTHVIPCRPAAVSRNVCGASESMSATVIIHCVWATKITTRLGLTSIFVVNFVYYKVRVDVRLRQLIDDFAEMRVSFGLLNQKVNAMAVCSDSEQPEVDGHLQGS